MIEAYAFLVMFSVQIVMGSIVFPERVIRFFRRWSREFASERFTRMYTQADYDHWVARFAIAMRTANAAIAVFGLVLLGWFYTLVPQPDWAARAKIPLVVFIFAQFVPLFVLTVYSVLKHFKTLMQPSQDVKRTAILQRRGLFDFVSPFAVWLAVATYVGFVALGIYMDFEIYGNTSLSRSFYIAFAALTAAYALNGFVIYKYLYGRKNPLVSHEGRTHSISVNVKGAVYGSIATAWFFLLMGLIGQPHLTGWQPFALSLFIVAIGFLTVMGFTSSPRRPPAGGLRTGSEVTS
jgi:hypothetical protein